MRATVIAAVAAAALSFGAATAVAVQTGSYAGTTSQVENGVHGKVKMFVATHVLVSFKYQLHASCQVHSSTGFVTTLTLHNSPFVNGRIYGPSTYHFTVQGENGIGHLLVKGSFPSPGHAKGTISASFDMTNPDGSFADHCSVSGVKWQASKQ